MTYPESAIPYVSSALASSGVITTSQARLMALSGYIDSTAGTDEYYVMAIGASSVPADGTVNNLITPFSVRHTNGTSTIFTIPLPFPISSGQGLVWCISTTPFSKTVAAGTVASIFAQYANP